MLEHGALEIIQDSQNSGAPGCEVQLRALAVFLSHWQMMVSSVGTSYELWLVVHKKGAILCLF
jgi:hypothetical protein